jgi:hypothetical protein
VQGSHALVTYLPTYLPAPIDTHIPSAFSVPSRLDLPCAILPCCPRLCFSSCFCFCFCNTLASTAPPQADRASLALLALPQTQTQTQTQVAIKHASAAVCGGSPAAAAARAGSSACDLRFRVMRMRGSVARLGAGREGGVVRCVTERESWSDASFLFLCPFLFLFRVGRD